MPLFCIKYKTTYYEDYGHDHEVPTGEYEAVIEAADADQAERVSKILNGMERHSRESAHVLSVTPYTGTETSQSLKSLLNPWNMSHETDSPLRLDVKRHCPELFEQIFSR